MKPVLIFDFDGTIADTHHYACQISNLLAEEFGYKKIDLEKLEELKNLTARQMVKYLDISMVKVPGIVKKGKKEFYKNIKSLNSFPGLKEILEELKSNGTTIGILSSNNLKNVTSFLKIKDMNIFDFVHSTAKIWGKDKTIKRLAKKKGIPIEDIIYIGDETRDIIAAQKINVKVAAVCWGYNSKKTLAKKNPDFLIETPKDLLTLTA